MREKREKRLKPYLVYHLYEQAHRAATAGTEKQRLTTMWRGYSQLYWGIEHPPHSEQGEKLHNWLRKHVARGNVQTIADLKKVARRVGGYKKQAEPWKYMEYFGQGSLNLLKSLVGKT